LTAPQTAVPARFIGAGGQALSNPAHAPWWTGFRDPQLDRLVARGLPEQTGIRMDAIRRQDLSALTPRGGVSVDLTLRGRAVRGAGGLLD